MALLMQDDQKDEQFNSTGRRKRLLWIVLAHLVVVIAFFSATFFWGNFA